MQITLVSITAIVGMLSSSAVTASPIMIKRQQDAAAAPYSITEPAASVLVYSGQNLGISWIPGDNTPLTIGLASASSDSTEIQLADDVNGSSGTHVVQIPSVVENCSQWKISLAHGNDTSAWSEPFYIATGDDTKSCIPSASVTPAASASATAMQDRLSGATMSASIDILGDDGQPVHRDNSESSALLRITTPVNMLGTAALSALLLAF